MQLELINTRRELLQDFYNIIENKKGNYVIQFIEMFEHEQPLEKYKSMRVTNDGKIFTLKFILKDESIEDICEEDVKEIRSFIYKYVDTLYPLSKQELQYETSQYRKDTRHFIFGKYKNQQIRNIYESDPQYILWCMYNVDEFDDRLKKNKCNKFKQKSK